MFLSLLKKLGRQIETFSLKVLGQELEMVPCSAGDIEQPLAVRLLVFIDPSDQLLSLGSIVFE